MTKAFALYQFVLLGLHTLDLYTTSKIPTACEGNPFMRMLWERGGFGGMIAAKVVGWMLMLAYHLAILRWLPPEYSKVAWLSMLLGLVFMVMVVAWNFGMVFIRGT